MVGLCSNRMKNYPFFIRLKYHLYLNILIVKKPKNDITYINFSYNQHVDLKNYYSKIFISVYFFSLLKKTIFRAIKIHLLILFDNNL